MSPGPFRKKGGRGDYARVALLKDETEGQCRGCVPDVRPVGSAEVVVGWGSREVKVVERRAGHLDEF